MTFRKYVRCAVHFAFGFSYRAVDRLLPVHVLPLSAKVSLKEEGTAVDVCTAVA